MLFEVNGYTHTQRKYWFHLLQVNNLLFQQNLMFHFLINIIDICIPSVLPSILKGYWPPIPSVLFFLWSGIGVWPKPLMWTTPTSLTSFTSCLFFCWGDFVTYIPCLALKSRPGKHNRSPHTLHSIKPSNRLYSTNGSNYIINFNELISLVGSSWALWLAL